MWRCALEQSLYVACPSGGLHSGPPIVTGVHRTQYRRNIRRDFGACAQVGPVPLWERPRTSWRHIALPCFTIGTVVRHTLPQPSIPIRPILLPDLHFQYKWAHEHEQDKDVTWGSLVLDTRWPITATLPTTVRQAQRHVHVPSRSNVRVD